MSNAGKVHQEFFFSPSPHMEHPRKERTSSRGGNPNISVPPTLSEIAHRSTGNRTIMKEETQAGIEQPTQGSPRPSSSSGRGNGTHPGAFNRRPSNLALGIPTHHASKRGNSLTNKANKEAKGNSSYLRDHCLPQPSNEAIGPYAQQTLSGKYRTRSLNITPLDIESAGDTVEVYLNKGHRRSAPRTLGTQCVESRDTHPITKKNEKIISVEKLTKESSNEMSSSSGRTTNSRADVSSVRQRGSIRLKNDSTLSAGTVPCIDDDIPPPRMPRTSTPEAPLSRRATSERADPFRTRSGAGSRAVSQPRHLGRNRALRSEGFSILPNIFCRGRLMSWPVGVAPQVVYSAETSHDLDDGHGAAGLSATLLCKMGAKHRAWDIVGVGQGFCVRVVGWHGGDLGNNAGNGGGRAVVYSVRHKGEGRRSEGFSVHGGPAQVHDERNCSDFKGYHYISERLGTAAGCQSSAVEQIGLTVGVWVGGSVDEGKQVDLQGEVRWRVLGQGDCDATGRNGASLLRYGYYFFLDAPCATRLFTNTDTPEHVRLMARREVDGAVDMDASKLLTYVVVRVTAD
ncbi:unnamed protein product [Chondrus crispus]|uniref:Uncharacterized protein n=1 Tax=Chondrus crispus TaxID=2769 RepID=R7QND9_CHOCR|nr:unnamed protein product [Chondrus crispus]CDF39308.1 unnamed protein product [Chondrus crispus]|eukprot:XP_005719219.1 unnamed protein product [Chondrus crispus]